VPKLKLKMVEILERKNEKETGDAEMQV